MRTRKKRVIYVHLHGSTGVFGDYGASTGRYFASSKLFGHPDLFPPDSELKLIPLSSDKTPKAAKENFTSDNPEDSLTDLAKKEDQFFFQWPGGISEETRDKAADYLADRLEEMTKNDDDVEFVFLGHSYGGRIGVKVAERFDAKPPRMRHPAAAPQQVSFHILTPAMPQIDTPPKNVKTLLHFYSTRDVKDLGGQVAYRNGHLFPLIKKTEDLYFEKHVAEGKDAKSFKAPEHVQSFDLTEYCGWPPGCHENILRKPASEQICKIAVPILKARIGASVKSEETPEKPTPSKF